MAWVLARVAHASVNRQHRCSAYIDLVRQSRIDEPAFPRVEFILLARGPTAAFPGLFHARGRITLNQSRRFAGSSFPSCVLTQSTMDTWTFASPDQGWLSTASMMVPVLTTWSRPPDARLVVAHVLRADQARSSRHGVLGCTRRQVVMGLAEPVHAVVSHARDLGIRPANGVDVVGPALRLEPLGPQERRIADHDIDLGPRRGIASRVDQGIAHA